MNIREYGKGNEKTVLLIHGGGLSWWNYKAVAEIMVQRGFHVILPIIGGHADSDGRFESIACSAKEIITYIDKNFDGYVYMMGGVSLGAQILLEILSMRKVICDYAIVESALVFPMKVTSLFLEPSVKMTYRLMRKTWFSKLQFRSLHINPSLYSEYYRATCKIKRDDMISFLKANASYHLDGDWKQINAKVLILVGKKERPIMHRSAQILHELITGSMLKEIDKLYHGEISLNYPEEYVSIVQTFIEKGREE